MIETKENKQYTRTAINTQFVRLGKKLGFKITPHIFRHTWATRSILKDKLDLKGVSNYLGHSSTSITLDMYTHSSLSVSNVLCSFV